MIKTPTEKALESIERSVQELGRAVEYLAREFGSVGEHLAQWRRTMIETAVADRAFASLRGEEGNDEVRDAVAAAATLQVFAMVALQNTRLEDGEIPEVGGDPEDES